MRQVFFFCRPLRQNGPTGRERQKRELENASWNFFAKRDAPVRRQRECSHPGRQRGVHVIQR